VSVSALFRSIFAEKDDILACIIALWPHSPRFVNFVNCYSRKILRKINQAKNHDGNLAGVLAELDVAYLLLQNERFSVEYEHPYPQPRTPDLTVTFSSGDTDNDLSTFNVEVKRMRKRCPESRFERWKEQVQNQIEHRISTIKSTLGLAIDVDIDLNDLCRQDDWLDGLDLATPAIIDYAIQTMDVAEGNVPSGKAMRYPVPHWDGTITVVVSQPHRPVDHASYYGIAHTGLKDQDKYLHFRDVICEKLDQMVPDMVNVLAVSTDSATHDDRSLEQAIMSLRQGTRRGDDDLFTNKGLGGAADYSEKIKLLSGVLLRSFLRPLFTDEDPNWLFCNKNAEHPIPEDIGKILQRMDY
jgi:hypothetical protein